MTELAAAGAALLCFAAQHSVICGSRDEEAALAQKGALRSAATAVANK